MSKTVQEAPQAPGFARTCCLRLARTFCKCDFVNEKRLLPKLGFLHPNQLPARYAAVYAFFLESRDAMAERLKEFINRSTQATLTGNTFDDAASVEGILNFFRLGSDCGAFESKEIKAVLGVTVDELRSNAFHQFTFKTS